jgi:crotonobetainyl-CoA:carnitine CoA-transferase CaiB-like acyl-CoA transferase
MAESVLAFNSVGVLGAQAAPTDETLNEPAYGVFATADRPITLSIAHEDHFWRVLCDVLGWPDLGGLTGGVRRERSSELHDRIAAELARKDAAHWLGVLGDAGVPCGPVNDAAATLGDPMFLARDAFADIEGKRYPRMPVRRDGRPGEPAPGAAPVLGADTERYLAQLGYERAEIERMAAEGVVTMAQVNA